MFELKDILLVPSCPILCASATLDRKGVNLFKACEYDLEGIVAKRKDSAYESDERSASRIKNPQYSQIRGKHELSAQV
jgi:uncharacterized metal-binding protein